MGYERRVVSGRIVLSLTLALGLTLAGCDSVTDANQRVILDQNATFTFELDPDAFRPGEEGMQLSTTSEDLTGRLQGFSPSEIVEAHVVAARIERIEPVGVNLADFLSDVRIELEASGLSGTEVAVQATMPEEAEADLTVTNTQNFAPYLKKPEFVGRLRFVAGTFNPDVYSTRAHLTFRITLEGL